MICHKKTIQGLSSTITENVLFFKDFKVLKKQWQISIIFKYIKDLYELWPLSNYKVIYD